MGASICAPTGTPESTGLHGRNNWVLEESDHLFRRFSSSAAHYHHLESFFFLSVVSPPPETLIN